MKRLILLSLMAGFVLVASAASAQEDAFTPGDCAITVPAGEVEGETFICGTVAVPELHEEPDGQQLELQVVIVKSDGDSPQPDPFVPFNGGPGSDSLSLVNLFLDSPIRADRDIVVFTERGTPGANPNLECPEVDSAADDLFGAPMDEVFAARLKGYEACRARLISEGVNLNAYNNPERTADVPVVMSALGYDQFNVWGVSGGGFLAQLVNRNYPDRVRTVMTDSGSQPEAYMGDVFLNIMESGSSSYRLLFETCAADATCSDAYPDLESTYWNAIDALNENPAPVTITNPETGESADIMLTGDAVMAVISNSFSNVANLPRIMTDIASGDYSYVLDRLPADYLGDPNFSDGLYQSVFCAEMGQYEFDDLTTEGVYAQVRSGLEPYLRFNIAACDIWDVTPVARGEVIKSDTPILIMEGVYDTNKQPELGRVVVQNYTTGYLVEFGDKAHVTISPCAISIMTEFMNDPAQPPNTDCVAAKPDFVVASEALTFSDAQLDAFGIAAAIPDGWQELQPGVYQDPVNGYLLILLPFPGETEAEGLAAFTSTLGLPAFDRMSEEVINGNTWGIYSNIDDEGARVIALTPHNGQVYVIGLQSSVSEISTVAESILRPVVESIRFLD